MPPPIDNDRVRSRARSLISDRRGLSTLEYALLFVIICVGALALWSKLGKRLVCQVSIGQSSFVQALGGAAQQIPGLCPPASPPNVFPWPSPASGGAAQPPAPKPANGTLPTALSNSARDAPNQVSLPAHVETAMQNSYAGSFPGGKSQERGATLVQDEHGNIKVINERSGTSGTMSPDRTVGPKDTIIGTYHTHPYDASEGGYTGVSFSGADIAYANAHHEPIYVDAGTKQFMIMPSKKTNVSSADINKDWNAAFSSGIKSGKSMQDASAAASKAIAKKYDMAYYEGNHGSLVRVTP